MRKRDITLFSLTPLLCACCFDDLPRIVGSLSLLHRFLFASHGTRSASRIKSKDFIPFSAFILVDSGSYTSIIQRTSVFLTLAPFPPVMQLPLHSLSLQLAPLQLTAFIFFLDAHVNCHLPRCLSPIPNVQQQCAKEYASLL